MGEWSDYFEDFPDENPANYVGDKFDPKGAAALRRQGASVSEAQAKLDAEIKAIVEQHQPKGGKTGAA